MIREITVKEAFSILGTKEPRGTFYLIHDGTIYGIDNSMGDAIIREFDNYDYCDAWLGGDVVTLCTFPDDDEYYCKQFEVRESWVKQIVGEKQLGDFLEDYTWNETFDIYRIAKERGLIFKEEDVL